MSTVLLVENDQPLRTVPMTELKKDGWEARGTGSGENAMGLLRQGLFNLGVTDDPFTSALAGLDLLKHLQRAAGPPAIVISASRHPRSLGCWQERTSPSPFSRSLLRWRISWNFAGSSCNAGPSTRTHASGFT